MKRTSLWLVASLAWLQLGSGIGYAASTKPKQEDYWRRTGLSFSDFEKKVLLNCYRSSKTFLACVDSLNVVAGSLTPPALIATDIEKITNPAIGDKIEALGGGLSLFKTKKVDQSKDFIDSWKEVKVQKANHLDAIQGHFAFAATLGQAPFIEILERLKPRVLLGDQQNDESLFAADLFNVSLGVLFDPHTRIQTKEELDRQMTAPDDSFVGIGVFLKSQNANVVIQEVMKDGGAMAAGIKSKDIILEVDGKSTAGLSLEKATEHITGAELTVVKLKIKRKGQTLNFSVVRKKVTQVNVEYSMVSDTGTPYGYIKLRSFMDQSGDTKIKAAIQDLTAKGAKGLILDLRGNGGGLLDQGVKIGSLFLGKKKILSVKSLDFKKIHDFVAESDEVTKLPMVTLIDAHSASASEILSGALQDYGRSWLLGDRSFGKGSVQAPTQFDAAGKIVMFQTIERFYQPSGRTNQIQGIIPDFNVDPFPGATDSDRFALREEDLYSNALPSVGNAWLQPRPLQVAQISACKKSTGLANALYKKNNVNAVNPPDYRLFTAEDVLNCIQ